MVRIDGGEGFIVHLRDVLELRFQIGQRGARANHFIGAVLDDLVHACKQVVIVEGGGIEQRLAVGVTRLGLGAVGPHVVGKLRLDLVGGAFGQADQRLQDVALFLHLLRCPGGLVAGGVGGGNRLGQFVGLLDVQVTTHARNHEEHDEDNQQDLQTLTFTGHEFVLLGTPAAWAVPPWMQRFGRWVEGLPISLGTGEPSPARFKTQTASSRLLPPGGSGRPGGKRRLYAGFTQVHSSSRGKSCQRKVAKVAGILRPPEASSS